jgi:hypothetical protein
MMGVLFAVVIIAVYIATLVCAIKCFNKPSGAEADQELMEESDG